MLGWASRLVPEDRKRVQAQIADSIARGESSLDLGFRVQLPDGSLRELEGSGRLLYGEDGSALRLVGVHIDATGRKRSEERQRLLLHELNHRVKNTLATVQSIAMQTFRGGAAEARATETFVARLIALSKTHDVLTRENWESADLLAVVSETLAPHCGDGARFEIEGRSLRVPPRLALSLAMALHELCTNAAKYGALSSPGGRVSLRWSAAGRGRTRRLRLAWQESGGPPVVPPERRGFGSRLIETGLARELGGEVRLAFEAPGVACDITVPLAAEAAG